MICRAEMAPSRAAPRWESRLVRVNKVIVDVHAIARGDEVYVGGVARKGRKIVTARLGSVLWPFEHHSDAEP